MLPDATRHRYTLSWADPAYPDVTSVKTFLKLEECRAYVRDVVKEPVELYDVYAHQKATLFPSGALRWKNR